MSSTLWSGGGSLTALLEFARSRGLPVYVAGGAVRDLILGRGQHKQDIDLVWGAGIEAARGFAKEKGYPFVLLDGEHGICRVVAPEGDLDFSDLRAPGQGIEADLKLRDFTLNAMALPLEGFLDPSLRARELIDPLGGLADLRAGLVRMTAEVALWDDPLRCLRAYRLAAEFNLSIEPKTSEAIGRRATDLGRVAGERIRAELFKMLSYPSSFHLREMAQNGLLFQVLPELVAGRGVPQRGYHHLDILEHSLLTFEKLEGLLGHGPCRYFACLACTGTPEALEVIELPEESVPVVKLAALLHDLGKPQTAAEAEGERISFHRHEEAGAEMAKGIGLRLRFSKVETERLTRLIGLHMRPFHLVRELRQGTLTERAMRRLVDAAGRELAPLFLIAMADSLAASGPDKPEDSEEVLARLCCETFAYLSEKLRPMRERPRLLSGDDIMEAFGVPEGPKVGKLLEAVEDARLEGEVRSRDEALALVSRLLKG